MSSRSNNNRRNRRVNRKPRQSPMLAVQKQILASNRAQEIKSVPTVPDVAPLVIKRLRVHTIQAKIELTGPTTQFGVFTFTLSDFPDSSSIVNLFDQYRVAQIVLDFYGEPATSDPIITAIDYTDAVVPTSVPDTLDKETAQVNFPATSPFFRRVFNPRYVVGNVTPSLPSTISSGWIPTSYGDGGINDTVWFGLKYAFFDSGPTVTYSVIMTVVLNLRATD